MSAAVAELTLILKAQDLTKTAVAGMKSGLDSVSAKAHATAQKVANSFKTGAMHNLFIDIAPAFGRVIDALARQKNVPQAFAALGIIAAGSLASSFGDAIIDKIAGSRVVAKLSAYFAVAAKGFGAVMASAMAIGMAALPFVLAGVLVAALAYLVTHPSVVARLHAIAMTILHGIADGLRMLTGILVNAFVTALHWVAYWVGRIVGGVVDIIMRIPRAISEALRSIHLLNFQLPNLNLGSLNFHASGGWVGLNGPEIGVVGERGPEYIVPNNRIGSMGAAGGGVGVRIVGVSEQEIIDMVDRGLYFKLRAASPAPGRP